MRCPSCAAEDFITVDQNIVCEYCGADDIQDLLYGDPIKADKAYEKRCKDL